MPILNEQLLDIAIAHQIGLERYATTVVRQVLAVLERAQVDLATRLTIRLELEQLDRRGGPWVVARLRALVAEIEQQARDAYSTTYRYLLLPILRELARREIVYQSRALQVVLPGIYARPADEDIEAAVENTPLVATRGLVLEQEVDAAGARQFTSIAGSIQAGAVAGATIAAILRRIAGTSDAGYEDGVFQDGRDGLTAITRTAVNHTAGVAALALYRANPAFVRGFLLVPILDSRTSKICRAIGTPAGFARIQPLTGGRYPPFHLRCRTTKAPYVGQGAVPEEPRFEAWVRRQPVAVQNEVLGERRGRALRAGGKLDTEGALKTLAGKPYTLEQLGEFGLSRYGRPRSGQA